MSKESVPSALVAGENVVASSRTVEAASTRNVVNLTLYYQFTKHIVSSMRNMANEGQETDYLRSSFQFKKELSRTLTENKIGLSASEPVCSFNSAGVKSRTVTWGAV